MIFASPDGSSTGTLIVADFFRKIDFHRLKGDAVGRPNVEPGAPRRWTLRFSLVPLAGGSHPVAEHQTGWEVCAPLIAGKLGDWTGSGAAKSSAATAPAAKGSLADAKAVSLLSVDSSSVAVFDLKAANLDDGVIVKIREMGGENASAILSSSLFTIRSAVETNRVEHDLGNPPFPIRDGKVTVSLRPYEIKCLRLELVPTRRGEATSPRKARN